MSSYTIVRPTDFNWEKSLINWQATAADVNDQNMFGILTDFNLIPHLKPNVLKWNELKTMKPFLIQLYNLKRKYEYGYPTYFKVRQTFKPVDLCITGLFMGKIKKEKVKEVVKKMLINVTDIVFKYETSKYVYIKNFL